MSTGLRVLLVVFGRMLIPIILLIGIYSGLKLMEERKQETHSETID